MLFTYKFDNNKNIEKIEFNFSVEENTKKLALNLVDVPFHHVIVSVEDSNGKIRLLTSFKSYKKIYYITDHWESTSNCCIPGEIPSGEWKLKVLKNYSVNGEFKIEITPENNTLITRQNLKKISLKESFPDFKEWYKGELHNHTNISDGKISLKELKKVITENKIDFIFPTEHNSILTKFSDLDIPVIPSTELSLDDLGHFNLFGLKKFINYYDLTNEYENREVTLKKIFNTVKEQNGFISLNHPFHNKPDMSLGLFYNIDLHDLDFIEVINSPTQNISIYDKKALKAFDMLWKDGHKIFAVAGSDNHDLTIGDPLNYIRLDEYTTQNILKNLKKGRSYISRVGELKLSMSNNEKVIYPGDEVDGDISIKVHSSEAVQWNVIKNGEIIETILSEDLKISNNLATGDYLRIEAYNENNDPVIIINPIFNNLKEPTLKKWFEIKNSI